MFSRRASAAFTLVEIMLAVVIVLLVMTIALPSIGGLSRGKELRETYERFESLAAKASLNAVSEQRSWVIVWQEGRLALQPDEPTPEELESGTSEAVEELAVSEGQHYTLQRPASLLPPKETLGEWTFWRSGTCEPATITYDGPEGRWVAQFNPLTARGELLEEVTP